MAPLTLPATRSVVTHASQIPPAFSAFVAAFAPRTSFTHTLHFSSPSRLIANQFGRPLRRARIVMDASSASSSPPPQPSGGGDGQNSDDLFANAESETSESSPQQDDHLSENADNSADNDPTPSSTESLFNEEILRRRISQLNDRNRQNASSSSESGNDTVLDLSVVFDEASSEAMVEIGGESMAIDDPNRVIAAFEHLTSVWVIMFNAKDGSDGLYSLTIDTDNIILAFESKQEAQRYALCLEVQDFPAPQVCDMEPSDLRDFCIEAKIKLGFIPAGVMLVPPKESAVEDLDAWRGPSSNESGMSEEDIDIMRKRFDSLFGQ